MVTAVRQHWIDSFDNEKVSIFIFQGCIQIQSGKKDEHNSYNFPMYKK